MLWLLLACTLTEWPVELPTTAGSTAAGALEGTVSSQDGAPIAGAAVTTDPGGTEALTDSDGNYSIPRLLPGTYSLVVAATGFQTTTSVDELIVAGQTGAVDLVLPPAAALDGWLTVEVLGPDGAPWPGAAVTAAGDASQVVSTDADGVALFSGLGGQTVAVSVQEPAGRLLGESRVIDLPALGNDTLSFQLAGVPADGTTLVGSLYCSYCHQDIGAIYFASAHAQGLSAVDAVPWTTPPDADGLVGGLLRGAVPYKDGAALDIAWVPADPERAAWSGGAGGEVAWAPPLAGSAEASCFDCHTSEGAAGTTEAGVSCERCHGAGHEHAYATTDREQKITNPAWLAADAANAVCAECHQAPNLETWASGPAAVPGAQSDELSASAHGQGAWSARCTDCHDPHSGGLHLEAEDNSLCLSCHQGLDFADTAAIKSHTGHPLYQPDYLDGSGRCTSCHMPETAARLHWNDETGAGDLKSHLFVAIDPAESLADFDAAGTTTLLAGEFTPNSCTSCHAWNDWLFDGRFPGPTGDPTERSTHQALADAWLELWP